MSSGTCQSGFCKCDGFMRTTDHGCSKDEDCKDCKLNWKLLIIAIVGGLVGLGLLFWGFLEQHRANKEGHELALLIRKAAQSS